MSGTKAAQLRTVAQLYRDCLRAAKANAYEHRFDPTQTLNGVRNSFRANAELKQTEEIFKAKEVATRAIGDFYTAQAYRLAVKEREMQHPQPMMPAAFQRSLDGTPTQRPRTPRRGD